MTPSGGVLLILLNDSDMYIIMQNAQSSYWTKVMWKIQYIFCHFLLYFFLAGIGGYLDHNEQIILSPTLLVFQYAGIRE